MRILIITLFSLFFLQKIQAQTIASEDKKQLKKLESFMQIQADSIINSQDWMMRFASDRELIQVLVQALKVKNSFYYNFDSLQISKVYAPDSSFKIFTWQVMKDFSYYRQRGAIQMRTTDGSLKLFPLFDASDFTERPTDSVRQADKWIGAIYYKIVLKTYNNKKVYTLLGSDENNERTNKKWIDILTFDDEGKPQFGRNCFVYPNDGFKPAQPCYRFCIEYRKNGGVRVRYDEKLDEIIFDRLISEGNDPNTKSTLIPYGDYEGFKWTNGKWYFTAQPFDALDLEEKPKLMMKPILDNEEKKEKKRMDRFYKKN